MNNIKISIIIPVYNVEEYLEQCLESIINQTIQEIEIICVNDGSTDRSPQILQEFSKKDNRIKILHKENGGIASARNKGLEIVTGKYIGFVDSDDWIEPHMYETLYNNAETNGNDMVMCSAHIFDDQSQELRYDMPYFTLEYLDESFDDVVFDHTHNELIFGINVTAWNKIYKTSFLKENNIKFHEGLDFEDNPFFYETYLKAKKVSLIREPLYYYRVNRNGSFITSGNRRFYDIVPIHKINERIIKENYPEYLDLFYNYKVNTIISRLNQVDMKYKQEFLDIIKEDFKEMDPSHIKNLNPTNKKAYDNVINAETSREYVLYEKIRQIEFSMQEKLDQQWLEYDTQIKKQRLAYNKKLKNKNKTINELTTSTSWKITKPLRKVGSLLKKQKA